MVILPPKAVTTFSNMATTFPNMARTRRNKKITFYDQFTFELCKCPMTVTNNSMTISQDKIMATNQPNVVLISFITKNLPWVDVRL